MKRTFSLLTLLIAIGFSTQAQSLKFITLYENIDVSDSTFRRVFDNSPGADHAIYLKVMNTTNDSVDVRIKRYEVSVEPTSKNYFCWHTCYTSQQAGVKPELPSPMPSFHFLTIVPNSLSVERLFAHHEPEGVAGVNTYRYVAYLDDNPSDSVYVDIVFDIGVVGIEENKTILSQVYPNPSNGSFILDVDGLKNNGTLDILDLSGKIVHTATISSGTNSFDIGLSSGIYVYRIKEEGVVRKTRRMVIE